MKRTDIDFAQAWTRKLEALGVVQAAFHCASDARLTTPNKHGGRRKNAGRRRIAGSNAERCRRYRRRKVSATRFSSEIY